MNVYRPLKKPFGIQNFLIQPLTMIYPKNNPAYTEGCPQCLQTASFLYKFSVLLSFCYHKRLSGHSPGSRFSILFVIIFHSFIYFEATEKPRKPYGSGASYAWTQSYLTITIYMIYLLISDYSMMEATRPDPTVRPPSRIAKLRPCSIATGWISSMVISTLSPGMHISVPSGSLQTPVTSVVLK